MRPRRGPLPRSELLARARALGGVKLAAEALAAELQAVEHARDAGAARGEYEADREQEEQRHDGPEDEDLGVK